MMNMEFISLMIETGIFHIFTRASHLWKYKKSCLTNEINPIFNVKPLNIFYVCFYIQVNISILNMDNLEYAAYV